MYQQSENDLAETIDPLLIISCFKFKFLQIYSKPLTSKPNSDPKAVGILFLNRVRLINFSLIITNI